MSWLFTLTEILLLACLWTAPPAGAQNLESALMPGSVIQGHAKYEADCEQCHVRFDRSAQPRLCLDCHKPVAADVRNRAGYHGRLAERECRTCHTEHKGRGARVVALDEKKFDHAATDFPLRGKHQRQSCSSCHRPRAKHRDAPGDCAGCHRKDDKHKGGLGLKCESCHNENVWKEARFDHSKTRFSLLLSHADVKCADCHLQERYADTPRDCNSCHRPDDVHKGRFGPRCDTCHNAGEWKLPTFRHDRDTHFPLLDRHRTVKCASCHQAPLYREKTQTRCLACHRSDDTHRGSLGEKCDKCHNEKGWKTTRFEHDRDTDFPLRDKHKAAKCDSCHRDAGLREKLPTRCFACHERDDREKGHKGRYGEKCGSCHDARDFKHPIFDHDKDTAFALAGKHRKAKCDACHQAPLYRSKTDSRCHACHKDDDVHFGSLDLNCGRCHVASDWRRLINRELLPPDLLGSPPNTAAKR